MHAEQALHHFADFGLADTLLAPQRERGAALDRRALKNVGKPRHHPCVERVVALADVVVQMREELGAVALARLDREAAPQIVKVRHVTSGEEADVLVLAAASRCRIQNFVSGTVTGLPFWSMPITILCSMFHS